MDNKSLTGTLSVSSAPHIVTKLDTAKTMQWVLIALAPAFIMSIVNFGVRSALLTIVCVAACAFFEWGYEKIMHKDITVGDFSACVTGVILAFNMPSNFPFWMAIIGCFTAIVVAKQLFGGIGRNFANPAIVGRIVLLLSFTTQMTTWPVSKVHPAVDAATGATPMSFVNLGATPKNLPALSDMALGFTGGAMGEVSAVAILIGLIILIWKKIISPIIPCSMIATIFVIALIYYGVKGGDYSALHMAMYHVLGGGAMFGAVFCATDYATSPNMKSAKLIYGIGCGAVTMVIRLMCSYPEGVSFAILFMNVATPLIDKYVEERHFRKRFGGEK
ncbi:electron transport complex protein RnfD [Eubacterium pyruvativorans]|uniref:Ion-translocating oxidoreductase complex subunit D n=1 Tax=Eubacterium pyruvativorans TaxID=155865 RepID=A0A1I7FQS6_9FIRM|nr:RnfABCDGE type electron transport complex subunit D [Eubacterium pyruvativorans]MDY4050226.1 RnfABCDGE type electron transport complex subunit D [Eubacterium pyruvativorans]SFN96086.1 electron transport complex protein RnfD [Eubacterium pyruvativorans]SFU38564.1 electron transport complex protein RnfD [Eubacterium pyruvativorans]